MKLLGFICLFLLHSSLESSGEQSNRTTPSSSNASTTETSTTTTMRTTPLHSTNSTASTTQTPDECGSKTNCDACIDNYKCYWCGPSSKCVKYPHKSLIPKDCAGNKWYWKQCNIPGYVLIIVVPCLAVLILLTCGCCIYCKCCRTKSKNIEENRINRRRREMKERNEERKQDRQRKSDHIRQKYGLLKSEDEEPLI